MQRIFIAASAAVLCLVITSQAQAIIIIDEFNSGNTTNPGTPENPAGGSQSVLDTDTGSSFVTNTNTMLSGVLGGKRIITVNLTAGGNDPFAELNVNKPVTVGSPGRLQFRTGSDINNANGEFSVVWDGFATTDFTESGANTGFILQGVTWIHTPGSSITLTITATDSSGFSKSVIIANITSNADFFVGFSTFGAPAGFFGAIKKIELSGNPPAGTSTLKINRFIVATPEPTSLTLFGLGIVGLLGYGVRRRKKGKLAGLAA